jgi:hypothetical protein
MASWRTISRPMPRVPPVQREMVDIVRFRNIPGWIRWEFFFDPIDNEATAG